MISLDRPCDYRESEGARFEVRLTKARAINGKDAEPFEAQLVEDNGKLDWATRDIDGRAVMRERAQELKAQGMSLREIGREIEVSVATASRWVQQ